MHGAADRRPVARRWIGAIVGIASLGVAVLNLSILTERLDSIWMALASVAVWSLAIGGAASLASVWIDRIAWVQPAYAFAAGMIATWDGAPSNLNGFVIVFLSLLYSWELGYLDTRGRTKVTVALVLFMFALVAGGISARPGDLRPIITLVLAAAALAAVGWYVIVRRIRDTERREAELEARVADRTADLETALAAESHALDGQKALLAEMHHRTRNNLQLVSSLLSLERDVGTVDSAWIDGAQSRIWSLSRLHELLYASTPSQETDLAYFLQEYLSEIGDVIGRGPIGMTSDVSVDRPVPVDLAIRFALILNEIILGAAESATHQNQRGHLRVSVVSDGHLIRLTAADDLTETEPSGDRLEIGLEIIGSLAQSLGGTVLVDRSKGRSWVIEVPIIEAEADAGS